MKLRASSARRFGTIPIGHGRCLASAIPTHVCSILGLAPAAHGANRTGRVFTGDGGGGSGDFLMAALHRNGFASIPTSQSINDGLRLKNAFIAAAVRCAPPDNKPLPEEINACQSHLEAELACLTRLRVVVVLGKIAFDVWWRVMARRGLGVRPRPAFAHGAIYTPDGGPVVIALYHPSPQNTNTGKLTPGMMSSVFGKAAKLVQGQSPKPPKPRA